MRRAAIRSATIGAAIGVALFLSGAWDATAESTEGDNPAGSTAALPSVCEGILPWHVHEITIAWPSGITTVQDFDLVCVVGPDGNPMMVGG